MRLAVVGSRTFTDADLMWLVLNTIHNVTGPIDVIVSGGAEGADKAAAGWASVHGFHDERLVEHLPDWERHGKAAGFIRNQRIVNDADALAAFFGPDGTTPGTRHAIRCAYAKRIPVYVYWQRR